MRLRSSLVISIPTDDMYYPTLTPRCRWWSVAASSMTARGATGPTSSSSPRSGP